MLFDIPNDSPEGGGEEVACCYYLPHTYHSYL